MFISPAPAEIRAEPPISDARGSATVIFQRLLAGVSRVVSARRLLQVCREREECDCRRNLRRRREVEIVHLLKDRRRDRGVLDRDHARAVDVPQPRLRDVSQADAPALDVAERERGREEERQTRRRAGVRRDTRG